MVFTLGSDHCACLDVGLWVLFRVKNGGGEMRRLIYNDDGTLRRCDRNIKNLGYWKSLRWFGYRYILSQISWSDFLYGWKLSR